MELIHTCDILTLGYNLFKSQIIIIIFINIYCFRFYENFVHLVIAEKIHVDFSERFNHVIIL